MSILFDHHHQPVCIGCGKTPEEIPEYVDTAEELDMTPTDFVRVEEATYNSANGHFTCTDCYVAMGAPSNPYGWIAP